MILGLLFALLMVASPAWAANVYWAAHNGDNAAVCTTIKSTGTATAPGTAPGARGTLARAANCATVAGDVVWVTNSGTYTGPNALMRVSDGNNITGFHSGTSDSVRTILTGDITGPRPLIQSQGGWYCTDGANLSGAFVRSYVTIKHLKIDGGVVNDLNCATALMWIVGEHVTIDDIEIFNAYNVPIYASRNPITGQPGSGGPTTGQFLRVANSIIHDTGTDGQGVGVYAGGYDSLIENNEFYNTRGTMIESFSQLWAADRATIRNNYFHDQRVAFQATFAAQCSFIAVNGNGVQIYNNIIVNNTTSCPTADPSSYGIFVAFQATATANIYNNLIINPLGHGITVNLPVPNGAVTIKNNIFWNINQLAIMLGNGPTVVATNNACVSSQNCGATAKVTLANLTDCTVSNSDYHLKAGTNPCVDTGTSSGAPATDFAGVVRPQGLAYDLGPYERTGTDTTPPVAPMNLRIVRLLGEMSTTWLK